MSRESLDRIASSDEAVFAIDRTDRIVVWNGACEKLLGDGASLVLGRFCFDVMGGRDLFGNVHCYENCPVVHQIRTMPHEPIRRFSCACARWQATRRRSRSRRSCSTPGTLGSVSSCTCSSRRRFLFFGGANENSYPST